MTALNIKLQLHSLMKWSYKKTYGTTSLSAFTECPFKTNKQTKKKKKKKRGKSALPRESINVKNSIVNSIALRKGQNLYTILAFVSAIGLMQSQSSLPNRISLFVSVT